MDYTHYRWLVIDKNTNETTRTIVAKNEDGARQLLEKNEKLSCKIGGINKSGGK